MGSPPPQCLRDAPRSVFAQGLEISYSGGYETSRSDSLFAAVASYMPLKSQHALRWPRADRPHREACTRKPLCSCPSVSLRLLDRPKCSHELLSFRAAHGSASRASEGPQRWHSPCRMWSRRTACCYRLRHGQLRPLLSASAFSHYRHPSSSGSLCASGLRSWTRQPSRQPS